MHTDFSDVATSTATCLIIKSDMIAGVNIEKRDISTEVFQDVFLLKEFDVSQPPMHKI